MRILSSLAVATGLTSLVTALPRPAFHPERSTDTYDAYFFAYFTGDTIAGEKIYFAVSDGNDALTWDELSDGDPILTSTMGTKGARDPFVLRSHDGSKFWILATDLSIGSGTSWTTAQQNGSLYIDIWESEDLVTWGTQRHVKVSPSTAGMTWAPAAYYDDDLGEYVVWWASDLYNSTDTTHSGSSYERMLYATTTDFVTFSDPVIWQDAGVARIDSQVVEWDGTYYRFTKDDGGASSGCVDIIQDESTDLTAGLSGWTTIDQCIGEKAGTGAVEGPAPFRANSGDVNGEKWYLFVDEYTGVGYVPLETEDIANPNWTLSSSYSLPSDPRHGSVIGITAAELASLTSAYGVSSSKRSIISPVEVSSKRSASKHTTLMSGSPVLSGYNADPNMVIFGENYYIYPTTDGYDGWGGQTFYAWKSTNLVNWTRAAEPFLTLNGTSGNVPWATGNAWSPTIAERNGKYYFYFSGNNPTYDRKTIGVAVAPSPEGPFTAEPTAMITNGETANAGQAIDPCFFRDPVTGKYWLFWGNGNLVYAQLDDNMTSINWDTAVELDNLTDYTEAPYIVYRDGLYHLTYSQGDTGDADYHVEYSTSTSVAGPWTYQGTILSEDTTQDILATGSASIVNIPGTDDWYICYHRFAIPDGDGTHRVTTIDRLYFDEDTGLIETVVPTLTGVAARTL